MWQPTATTRRTVSSSPWAPFLLAKTYLLATLSESVDGGRKCLFTHTEVTNYPGISPQSREDFAALLLPTWKRQGSIWPLFFVNDTPTLLQTRKPLGCSLCHQGSGSHFRVSEASSGVFLCTYPARQLVLSFGEVDLPLEKCPALPPPFCLLEPQQRGTGTSGPALHIPA